MKGNTMSVHIEEEEQKKDLLMRKRAQRTVDENMWDTNWLRHKHPDRFSGVYEKWELGNDIYDPALFPMEDNQEEDVIVLSPYDGYNENKKYADLFKS